MRLHKKQTFPTQQVGVRTSLLKQYSTLHSRYFVIPYFVNIWNGLHVLVTTRKRTFYNNGLSIEITGERTEIDKITKTPFMTW